MRNVKLFSLLLIIVFQINYVFSEIKIDDNYPVNSSGTLNVIVEISAGDNLKRTFSDKKNSLEIEYNEKGPRVINYLPYPFNYGILPQTHESFEIGADGDPLDVLIIGESLVRGKLYEVKLIGIIEMIDGNEIDNKIITLSKGKIFSDVNSLNDLENNYPGTIEIIKLWLSNYKGGFIDIKNIKGKKNALKYIKESTKRFIEKNGN